MYFYIYCSAIFKIWCSKLTFFDFAVKCHAGVKKQKQNPPEILVESSAECYYVYIIESLV